MAKGKKEESDDEIEEIGSDILSSEEGSEESAESDSGEEGGNEVIDSENGEESEDDAGFEVQDSSSEDEHDGPEEDEDSEGEQGAVSVAEGLQRAWGGLERASAIEKAENDGSLEVQKMLHVDDLSSDDEEGMTNRVGRVPLHWYDEYEHIGYDQDGRRVARGKGLDGIDAALRRDDPTYQRTLYDAYNGREVVLTEREMELIRRIRMGAVAHPEHDQYPDYVDFNTWKTEPMPLNQAPPSKARFLPSKWEMMKVNKIIKGIKEGRISLEKKEDKDKDVFMIWKDDEEIEEGRRRGPAHVPAPRLPPPGHAESYRPPDEYLPTQEERERWEGQEPDERERNFLPTKHDSLRQVGAYKNFVRERFERCLDLYLCPRALKQRLQMDPESLVPKLPRPSELKPFPNTLALWYKGHTARVRALAVSVDGQYLASGSDDGTLRVWEVTTARCVRTFPLGGPVAHLAWNPHAAHDVLVACVGSKVYLVVTGTGNEDAAELTDALLENAERPGGDDNGGGDAKAKKHVTWSPVDPSHPSRGAAAAAAAGGGGGRGASGARAVLQLTGEAATAAWHRKGDYLVTVAPLAGAAAVLIHQVSKRQSQAPFKKAHGQVQVARFHPSKPFLFVATQTAVRVYHLVKQALVKKVLTGCKWISAMDVHPTGDHVLVGSYDRRVVWCDLDLSSKPYKTLKYHARAVRGAAYHPRYPLMASAADDGRVHVFHAAVYSDLLREPLIVPLKILRGHAVAGGLGVLAVAWHPRQPWLFSAGADGTVRLFQDV